MERERALRGQQEKIKSTDEKCLTPSLNLSDWITTKAFIGQPQPRKYLVSDTIPMGQVTLVASPGGAGKSYSCLSCARTVSMTKQDTILMPPNHFGGVVQTWGKAVYISGEDDRIEVHERLDALGGVTDNLMAVPMPSVGGAKYYFKLNPQSREPITTNEWNNLCQQLKEIENLALVMIEPLQVFCALDLNASENAQFVCSKLSALAAETGAAVVITHY